MSRHQAEALYTFCKQFVEDNDIYCSDTVYQCDRVIEKAYDFIDGVCKIIGYAEPKEDD